MGMYCICQSLVLPRPLSDLVHLVRRIRLVGSIVLYHLGLTRTLPQVDPFLGGAYYEEAAGDPLPPTADQIAPSVIIKSRLRVVEFGMLFGRHRQEPTCMVCLGWMEAKDEVRELGSCRHGFHKGCIDEWVDAGHVSCPLCRGQLLPVERRRRRRGLLWGGGMNFGGKFWR